MSVPFRAVRLTFNATAVDVRIDEAMFHVLLADGREIGVPLAWFPRLSNATRNQLLKWRIIGHGVGISWDEIDEDIEIEGLLRSK
jgi:hypothetical protein